MPVVKLGKRRQLVIPKALCDALGLKEGDFVELELQEEGVLVLKPKRLVDADDLLTPEEEAVVARGFAQLDRGEAVNWAELKHELEG